MGKSNFYMSKSLKMLSLALMALAISEVARAQITVRDLGQKTQFGRISVFDFDGDNDLDLVVGGQVSGDGVSNIQVYTNDGSGVFTAVTSPLNSLFRPTYDWNDVNQDGNPDLLLNGFNAGAKAKIYTTDGNGNFSEESGITLPQVAPTSGFADFNNDGYLDIFIFGNGTNSKILFSNAGSGYTESTQFNIYDFVDPAISVIDYDNDKDLDIFISASRGPIRFTKLFVNNNGNFTETTIAGLFPKGNGSNTWGDYNGDGFPDLLLNGDGFLNSGEDSDNYRLFKNNGDGTFTDIQTFLYRQNFTTGGGRFFDWDNDGDLDIVVTGWSPGQNRQATDIYLNNNGVFTAYVHNTAIPGSSEGAVNVGDADNDGDLDLFINGFSGNNWNGTGGFGGNIAVIALNPNNVANAAPTTPTNLAVTGNSAQLNFSWNASTDITTPQASLTYNLFLVDANGKWFYYPAADTTNGQRRTAKIGNVQYNKGWFVKNLPAGTYRWGVQAIDNSYKASAFAKGSFTINSNGTLPVTISDYKATIEGNYTVVKWKSLTEINVNKYVVERSTDGVLFTSIATIPAIGNSNNIQDYIARDHSPAAGKNYYRLTSIDNDAKTQVFDVLVLDFKATSKTVSIYPNPVVSSEIGIKIEGYEDEITVRVMDLLGRVLETKVIDVNKGNNYHTIALKQKSAPGLYKVNLTGTEINETISVLIQ